MYSSYVAQKIYRQGQGNLRVLFFLQQNAPLTCGDAPVGEEPNRLCRIGSPGSRLLAAFAYMLDIRDAEVSVFTTSGFILFLFLVLFAHLRSGYGDFVSEMLGEIDAVAAVEAIALSIFTCDRVFAGFIAFLQAAGDRHAFSAFHLRFIFLGAPCK